MSYKLISACLIALILPVSTSSFASEQPLVAVASGMQFAIKEMVKQFYRDSGIEVRLTLGSSGNLYRQIVNNAPFELFISAAKSFTEKLESTPFAIDKSVVIAKGRLAIFTSKDSSLKPDAQLEGLKHALEKGQVNKFAIANPVHAPYGQRAKQALISSGVWPDIKDKLVIGESVAQAAQFALSGGAEGGIIAQSLAISEPIAKQGQSVLLPESWHEPIWHSMILLKKSDQATQDFFDYIQSDKGQLILANYGFGAPE